MKDFFHFRPKNWKMRWKDNKMTKCAGKFEMRLTQNRKSTLRGLKYLIPPANHNRLPLPSPQAKISKKLLVFAQANLKIWFHLEDREMGDGTAMYSMHWNMIFQLWNSHSTIRIIMRSSMHKINKCLRKSILPLQLIKTKVSLPWHVSSLLNLDEN